MTMLGAAAVGCRGDATESRATTPTPVAAPTEGVGELPYLTIPLERTSSRFQRIWRVTLAASEVFLEPPERADELRSWTEQMLRPWLSGRTEAISVVRIELRALRGGSRDEYLVGAALLGYLFEDTARQLGATRVPDPAGAGETLAAPEERIEMLLEHARRSYARCLDAGLGGLEIAAWRAHCDDALHRLGPPTLPDEESVVRPEEAEEGAAEQPSP